MSSFTSSLVITPATADGMRFQIVSKFSYYTEVPVPESHAYTLVGREDIVVQPLMTYIHVSAGYITDFASVPRGLWWLIPPIGRYGKAAVIHDYLYDKALGTKLWADQVFYEAMKVLGVPWWKRAIMYRSVRWFGKGKYS